MKLRAPFIQLPLQFDATRLLAKVSALDKSCWLEHPQKFPGNFALPLISVNGDPQSDAFAGTMRPTPSLRDCPYLMQVLLRIGAVWGAYPADEAERACEGQSAYRHQLLLA